VFTLTFDTSKLKKLSPLTAQLAFKTLQLST